MSPRKTGRRRMFGKARKTVKIDGQKFTSVYTMSKVLIHEPPPQKHRPGTSLVTSSNKPRVHGPYSRDFDYSPFMPKKRNGRWVPGKWLPVIARQEQAMCRYGYHACTMDKTPHWTRGWSGPDRIWLVEGVGPLEEDPKSQKPMTAPIMYHLTPKRWVSGRTVDGKYVPGHYSEPRKLRDKKAERARKEKMSEAKENGGFAYDVSADKYNFQSIRIIRPLTDLPRRTKKPPEPAPTTWRQIRVAKDKPSVRVRVYARTGRIVPGQGVRAPRRRKG